jgi:hypothetical protein
VYETAKLNSDGTIDDSKFSAYNGVFIDGFIDGLGKPGNGRALSIDDGNAMEPPYCVARKPDGAARGLVKSRADFALLAEWLSACETKHISRCERSSSATPLHPGFRVIDVQARYVVHPTSACRDVALSYVWGGCCSVHLEGQLRAPAAAQQHLATKSRHFPYRLGRDRDVPGHETEISLGRRALLSKAMLRIG